MNKRVFWGCVIIIITFLLMLISNILAPFVIAFIFAYLLHPLIDKICTKFKLPRTLASAGVCIIFLSCFITALSILAPIIYQQTALLISKIPAYKDYLLTELVPTVTKKISALDPHISDRIENSMQGLINGIFSLIAGIFNNVWGYTMATINIFAILLLVPIILLYFLKDWPKMTKNVEDLLPLKEKNKIKEILLSIDNLLAGYIRGQLNVCLLLSTYYGIGLTIIGVDLSLLLGFLSGFLILIPFMGTFIAFTLTFTIGYFAFGFSAKLGVIVGLYVIGYLMENYILTPKIIGDRIGLHPLWIMFAVFACGSLFGFIGIFFAIPIAGIIKVLIKYALEAYKSSKVYKS